MKKAHLVGESGETEVVKYPRLDRDGGIVRLFV